MAKHITLTQNKAALVVDEWFEYLNQFSWKYSNRGYVVRNGGTSRFKGVSWSKSNRKWSVRIKVNNKAINLGHFSDEIDAARACDRAARYHFGEFARPNLPES